MATIIENRPGERERLVEVHSQDSGAGWSVAVIVLIAVVGGLIWWFYNRAPAPAQNEGSTNINVSVPPLAAPPASGSGSANTEPNQ